MTAADGRRCRIRADPEHRLRVRFEGPERVFRPARLSLPCHPNDQRQEQSRPAAPTTAARVRLVLEPGQIAGLDSEEGRSLHLTCGGGAKTLVVNSGERSKLVVQQGVAVQETIADRVQERR